MFQGDIVITNYPFTSFADSKVRPAVIISNKKFNKGTNIILLAISTKKDIHCHELNQKDLEEGELLKKSYIRFSNILSMEKQLILKKVGKLKKNIIEMISGKLTGYFIVP